MCGIAAGEFQISSSFILKDRKCASLYCPESSERRSYHLAFGWQMATSYSPNVLMRSQPPGQAGRSIRTAGMAIASVLVYVTRALELMGEISSGDIATHPFRPIGEVVRSRMTTWGGNTLGCFCDRATFLKRRQRLGRPSFTIALRLSSPESEVRWLKCLPRTLFSFGATLKRGV